MFATLISVLNEVISRRFDVHWSVNDSIGNSNDYRMCVLSLFMSCTVQEWSYIICTTWFVTIIRQGDDEGETHTHTHRSANNSSCARFHIFRRISNCFRQHFQPFTQQSNQESSASGKIRRQIKKKGKKFVEDDKRLIEMERGENNIPHATSPKKRRRGWKMNQHKILFFHNMTRIIDPMTSTIFTFLFLSLFPPQLFSRENTYMPTVQKCSMVQILLIIPMERDTPHTRNDARENMIKLDFGTKFQIKKI